MLNSEEILKELERFCPWWKKGTIELEPNLIERDQLIMAQKEFERKKIVAIRGMRQVGKTTLIHQMMFSIVAKINPKRVLYCSFDLMRAEKGMVRQVIEVYLTQILREPLTELVQDTYIFLDEIQKVPDWGDSVKHYSDLQKKLHFVVSGSSALNLTKGAGEALIGRVALLDMDPFSFREFLRYKNKEPEKVGPLMGELIMPQEVELLWIEFERYKQLGGLPIVFELEDDYNRHREIRTLVDLSFARDIVDLYDVRNTRTIKMLFEILVENSSQRINYNTLGNSLSTKYETIVKYIDYLESAFFIEISQYYSKGQKKSSSKNPKIYASDHAFFILTRSDEGSKAETMAALHVKRQARMSGGEVFYWTYSKGKEVDIVLAVRDTLLPLEVKYTDNISNKDLKGLKYFCDEFGVDRGIVITKNILKEIKLGEKQINCIPLWLFLLTDGIINNS